MTDQAKVLDGLQTLVYNIVYPNGTSQPSIAGVDITIGEGWPTPKTLDKILSDQKALISLFPSKNVQQIPRFLREWETKSINTPTLTANVVNNTITIDGSVSLPQRVMAIINNVPYVYTVVVDDTLSTIATGLAALIPNATSVGSVITITNVWKIETKIIVKATVSLEVNRVNQIFWIFIYTADPEIRTIIGSAINRYLSEVISFDTSDGYGVMTWVVKDEWDDSLQETKLYKRMIYVKAQFPINIEQETTIIGDIVQTIQVQNEIN